MVCQIKLLKATRPNKWAYCIKATESNQAKQICHCAITTQLKNIQGKSNSQQHPCKQIYETEELWASSGL